MLKAIKPGELAKAAGDIVKIQPPGRRGARISDADRERAVERLHDALVEDRITVEEFELRLEAVYSAVHAGDLRRPLAGLPADDDGDLSKNGGRSDAKLLVLRAGASGITRGGDWLVPARLQVKSGMGSVVLDFSEAKIPHRTVQIELKLGTGSAKLLLPDDATANVDGLVASVGLLKCKFAAQPRTGAPHFVVLGRTRLGSVSIDRQRRGIARLRF